jgi:hypothetical protein
MTSEQIRPRLLLLDAGGNPLAEGVRQSAGRTTLERHLPPGQYSIIATEFSLASGQYTLQTDWEADPEPLPPCPAPESLTVGSYREGEALPAGCQGGAGPAAREYRFYVDKTQPVLIEVEPHHRLALSGPGDFRVTGAGGIVQELGPGGYQLIVHAAEGGKPYLLRLRGPCSAGSLGENDGPAEALVSPADCRGTEFGLTDRSFVHVRQLSLGQRATCTVDFPGAVVSFWEPGRAAGREVAGRFHGILSRGNHRFIVKLNGGVAGRYTYQSRCVPGPSCGSPRPITPDTSLSASFSEDDCRLCDFVPAAECALSTHAYEIRGAAPTKVSVDPPSVAVHDHNGSRLDRPIVLAGSSNHTLLVSAGALSAYTLAASLDLPAVTDEMAARSVGALCDGRAACVVRTIRPGESVSGAFDDADGTLGPGERAPRLELYRLRVVEAGTLTAHAVTGHFSPRILLSDGRGILADQDPPPLRRRLEPGEYVLAVTSRSRSRGEYTLQTGFQK